MEKIKYLIIITLICFNISCQKKKLERRIINEVEKEQSTVEVEFIFPDTMLRNESSEGEIRYRGGHDTIITRLRETKNGNYRYITFSFIKSDNINYSLGQLKKMKLDTIAANNNKSIPLYDIKFSKSGTYYIDGIINDHVYIDTNKISKSTNIITHLENESRVSHKIIVLDK